MDELSAYSASHHPDGLFVFAWAGRASGPTPPGAQITDLAPTLMHVLDVPVASWMDGRVLSGSVHRRRQAVGNLCGLRCGQPARASTTFG